jgi:AcrR family transcriptional regulator
MPSEARASSPRRIRKETAETLVRAAAKEFNERGFSGTDTNRIARRAGFAPQTFYRWFRDKTEIFIKVYELWQDLEADMLRHLLAEDASDVRLVKAVVAHHHAYRIFRRSLRQLAAENDAVREARARSRLKQIEQIRVWNPKQPDVTAVLAVTLLHFERLADALAEGEFRDMGLGTHAAEEDLVRLIHRLRAPSNRP